MGLPIKPLPRDTIEIEGQTVEYRSLSRTEAIKATTMFADNIDGAETFFLMCGCDISEEEATEWRNTTDPITVGKLVDAIIILTGLADAKN